MAYGNWGAFVYRGTERMTSWEDQTPYHEQDYEAGYHQAFGLRRVSGLKPGEPIPVDAKLDRTEELGPYHAVLGQMRVRLCGYKSSPFLYLDGEPVALKPFLVKAAKSYSLGEDGDYAGEIEGYQFAAHQYDDNMIDLSLTEPDGTYWHATCGYCYGAGHMD